MAADKDNDRKLVVEGPYVDIKVSDYGVVTARLSCYREKPRGGTEYLELKFNDLSVFELACIGQQARTAIDTKTRIDWERGRAQLKRVTG